VIALNSANVSLVFDTFLLPLIGIGSKIALVRYLEITAGMDSKTRARVMPMMLITEKSFGFLLAALGVQLFLSGLSHAGAIH
jgi:small neutral amino acid transporter SnatA (MarC family)